MDVLEEAELPLEKPLTQARAAATHAQSCGSHMHMHMQTHGFSGCGVASHVLHARAPAHRTQYM